MTYVPPNLALPAFGLNGHVDVDHDHVAVDDQYIAFEEAERLADQPSSRPRERHPRKPVIQLGEMSAKAIAEMDLLPVRFVVPDYIAEGLTILAGRPKTGKSWMGLGVGIAVASGGNALGSIPCDEGDVLYLALEDNIRRLQRRLKQISPYDSLPSRLKIDTKCPRLDEGGLEAIRHWIEKATDPKLVVVDVFGMVRPQVSSKDALYDSDYKAIGPLKQLADDFGIAILVLMHTRKMDAEDPFDTVSGSTGITGAADTVMVLRRDGQGVTLYGRGRDIEQFETALTFDPILGAWNILGAASEVRRSDGRKLILDALAREPMAAKDIAIVTGMAPNNCHQLLYKMIKDGEVVKVSRGRYGHPYHADIETPDKNDKEIRNGHSQEPSRWNDSGISREG